MADYISNNFDQIVKSVMQHDHNISVETYRLFIYHNRIYSYNLIIHQNKRQILSKISQVTISTFPFMHDPRKKHIQTVNKIL